MSIRVRETYGTSWQGSRPGTRHYRSTSVSYGLGTYLLGGLAWCLARGVIGLLVLLPFFLYWWSLLACAWVCAEMVLGIVTGMAVIAAVCRREARPGDITLRALRWHLVMFGLKGARP